jgi:glucose-6-phosphate 1-dehydrogenase
MHNSMEQTLVIFGVTGDLAQRKLLPALYNLHKRGELNLHRIIGVGRKTKTGDEFREEIRTAVVKYARGEPTHAFLDLFTYHKGEFHSAESYHQLKTLIQSEPIFYLSTPPNLFGTITRQLKAAGLTENAKVAFEKPFGSDLHSARELNTFLREGFREEQIYRIDHYIGKSAIQNIFALRFANSFFEPLLNNQYVDNIQITAAEQIGIEDRGAYYEKAGALRDMVQSHLLQMLALLTMDQPTALQSAAIHEQKQRALDAIERIEKFDVHAHSVRAQYSGSETSNAYTEEPDVAFDSATETFVALRLHMANERWSGVPIYIRTGKRLREKAVHITVAFKQSNLLLEAPANILTITIHPAEAISVTFNNKTPTTKLTTEPVRMEFCHDEHFGPNTPEAYERLFTDIIIGDKMLFPSWREVEASWEIVQPFLDAWSMVTTIDTYPAGSDGPAAANELLAKEGKQWL